MRVIEGLRPESLPACVVAMGMFDGVHRGHQALLYACRRHADRLGLPAVALTYEPHPSRVLRPDHPTLLLTPLPEKLERLEANGIDIAAIAEFTPAFSHLAPEQFIADLASALHPRVVVVGYRTTFGRDRAGTAAVLRDVAPQHDFITDIVEPIEIAGAPVSSTRIRQALADGQVELAAELLGYPYRLLGIVTEGDRRGHTLGIPTANLEVSKDKLVPADGIYVVSTCLQQRWVRGVMSIGNRPTFDRPRTLEAHLLDFSGDLYGHSIPIYFHARLRDVQSFPSPDALIAQIHTDIAAARALEIRKECLPEVPGIK